MGSNLINVIWDAPRKKMVGWPNGKGSSLLNCQIVKCLGGSNPLPTD
jgi:hypothetical protein